MEPLEVKLKPDRAVYGVTRGMKWEYSWTFREDDGVPNLDLESLTLNLHGADGWRYVESMQCLHNAKLGTRYLFEREIWPEDSLEAEELVESD